MGTKQSRALADKQKFRQANALVWGTVCLLVAGIWYRGGIPEVETKTAPEREPLEEQIKYIEERSYTKDCEFNNPCEYVSVWQYKENVRKSIAKCLAKG